MAGKAIQNKAIPILLICILLVSFLALFAPEVKAGYLEEGRVAAYLPVSHQSIATIEITHGETVAERWYLTRIMAPQAWQIVPGGSGVTVAVLDTGIDSSHEDLSGRKITGINFSHSPTTADIYGHGTFVAGIIGAADNGVGTTGLAYNSTLMNVKVAEDDGSVKAVAVALGIIWAADNGADVINISLIINAPDPGLEKAVEYAWAKGCVIVAAAGNSFSSTRVYPAAYPHVLAVAATDRNERLARWSNNGDWTAVAAPGVDIYSTLPGSRYATGSGTSYASALVSGEAALLFRETADLNGDGCINDEVFELIRNNCISLAANGAKVGRIDVFGAVTDISRKGSGGY